MGVSSSTGDTVTSGTDGGRVVLKKPGGVSSLFIAIAVGGCFAICVFIPLACWIRQRYCVPPETAQQPEQPPSPELTLRLSPELNARGLREPELTKGLGLEMTSSKGVANLERVTIERIEAGTLKNVTSDSTASSPDVSSAYPHRSSFESKLSA